MEHLSTAILTDILTEKIKRDTSEEYGEFVSSLNSLTEKQTTVEDLKQVENHFDKFLPQLDLVISTQGHEEIMNMKATLLDLFANDLSFKSIYLLSAALSNKKELTHLNQFMYPVTYWAPVIKSNELLTNAG
ncbi:hypothetical protein AKG34_20930 [Peribacillus butanolivorans]|uniref:hypothetical protein n=1 Tax=Peribacillus butanolivorans TaxID=421767 RepID=UPI0006A71FF8|nr:hypothetical protein [Peribacillus butanolivorans]KON70992.1 hypothetical protein AKG34_20930 [Peribacillus butanolivorans]MCO0598318.1 hypothetical protein [Peribacillus butanolivorans]